MPKITGLNGLSNTLKRLRGNSRKRDDGSVIVGYTANYALRVHETLEPAKGATGKSRIANRQGKYLEQPARTMRPEIILIVQKAAAKIGVVKALLIAGLRLQRESQKLVPVDTGNLRASAFTREEK